MKYNATQELDVKGADAMNVTISLGEVTLSLDEIAGLRKGVEFEVEMNQSVQCWISIGSAHLARGELNFGESGLRITIAEVA